MVDGKAVMMIDVDNMTRTVGNVDEPWVEGQVTLRLVNGHL